MGPGIRLKGGACVPAASTSSSDKTRERKRRKPWGGNWSTSSWARVTSITLRAASRSSWACSCWKSSLWLYRWAELRHISTHRGVFLHAAVCGSCFFPALVPSWWCLAWATRWSWPSKRKTRQPLSTFSWRTTRTTSHRLSTRRPSSTTTSTTP